MRVVQRYALRQRRSGYAPQARQQRSNKSRHLGAPAPSGPRRRAARRAARRHVRAAIGRLSIPKPPASHWGGLAKVSAD
eukprot:6206546-Pleurochrysis_carterae.AAC.6